MIWLQSVTLPSSEPLFEDIWNIYLIMICSFCLLECQSRLSLHVDERLSRLVTVLRVWWPGSGPPGGDSSGIHQLNIISSSSQPSTHDTTSHQANNIPGRGSFQNYRTKYYSCTTCLSECSLVLRFSACWRNTLLLLLFSSHSELSLLVDLATTCHLEPIYYTIILYYTILYYNYIYY